VSLIVKDVGFIRGCIPQTGSGKCKYVSQTIVTLNVVSTGY